ncbi:MAG: hypothetical protein P8080_08395 [Gammaproteobacteria bacterium]
MTRLITIRYWRLPAGSVRRLRLLCCVAFCLLGGLLAVSAQAEDAARVQMQGLDEQVQEIKTDVLGIAAELSQLEERLLFPSNTQVAVFVELKDPGFRLDAVRIHMDGELVAHYIYSFKELEALRAGGVQRIYTGNVPTGEHELQVAVTGKLDGGDDYSATDTFSFSKDVDPKLVGITLADVGTSGSGISLGDW